MMIRRTTARRLAVAACATLLVAADATLLTGSPTSLAEGVEPAVPTEQAPPLDDGGGDDPVELADGVDPQVVDAAPRLSIDAPDHVVDRNNAFVISVPVGGDGQVDGVLRFDDRVLEFGGATALDPDATLLQAEAPNGVALTIVGGASAAFEARFIPLFPADVTIAFDAVDANGTEATRTTVVSIRDGEVTGPDLDAPAAPADADLPSMDPGDAADLTGNLEVDEFDAVEAQIVWTEQLGTGSHCDLTDNVADSGADLNGDGCLGAADIAAIVDEPAPAASPASAPAGGSGATFVVTTTTDEGDNQLNDDLCITPTGGCSLRAALLQSNATPGPNRIEFDIPGAGPHTILLDRKLTTINDPTGPVVIDGYTQPGASENTDPQASNADIRIILEMQEWVQGQSTIAIASANNVVRGLSIIRSFNPILLKGDQAVDNHIVGNFLGTNPAGTFSLTTRFSNSAGVQLDDGAARNRVGTPAIADRNVISGNRSWGIRVEQAGTDGNLIQNNLFGVHPDGTTNIRSHGGIDIQYGPRNNLVGGRAEREHNVFAGLDYAAIDFSHNSFENDAIGNYIGTDLTGTRAFSWTDNRWGLLIKDDSRLNHYEANVVVNQREEGIYNKHNYTGANTFVGNLIGLTLDGTAAGNARHGAQVRGHDDVFVNNIIANNTLDGINLDSQNDRGFNDDEITERNLLSRNAFWNNGQQGIDITPNGQNANDPGDGDGGTQAGLNHPELATASSQTVTGTACAGCTVEIYLAEDGSSAVEGRQFLGSVIADGAGSFAFSDSRLVDGQFATALAIDALLNTSEFSPALAVTASGGSAPGAPTVADPGDQTFSVGTPVSLTVSASPAGAVFTALRLPDGLTIDDTTGVVSGTPLTAGRFPVTFLVHNTAGVDAVDAMFTVNGTQVPPTIEPIADRSSEVGLSLSLQVVADDANDDQLTYDASGLPTGLTIDDMTGLISGTATTVGEFDVVVSVDDGFGPVTEPFRWSITAGFTCSVTGNTLTWNDQGVSTYYIRQVINGENNYLDAVTGALEYTVPSQFGAYQVIAYLPERIETQCDAPLGNPEPFECSVTGNTLNWTNQGVSTYYIRQVIDGENNYLDAVTGALEYTVPSQFGAYQVIAYLPERIETQCDAPLGNPEPIECSVTGNTLTWTNQGANVYYIRQIVSGVNQYVDSSAGLSLTLPDSFGVFEVRATKAGQLITTQCDGVLLPDFTCSVDASGLVTWTDQQANAYFVRRVVNGTNSYVGSSTGLSYQLSDLSGDIRVRYNRSGTQFSTACPPA